VPGAGLEPARLAAGDFESPESTNFTTRAVFVKTRIMTHFARCFVLGDGAVTKISVNANALCCVQSCQQIGADSELL
jgi:hypothetical protein